MVQIPDVLWGMKARRALQCDHPMDKDEVCLTSLNSPNELPMNGHIQVMWQRVNAILPLEGFFHFGDYYSDDAPDGLQSKMPRDRHILHTPPPSLGV